MSLFTKKEQKGDIKKNSFSPPELPELPKLPEFPDMSEFQHSEEPLPQLPKFPNNSLGNKFSQDTIKEAITGKEEDEEVFGAEDFPNEERGMMQKPLQRYSREEDEEKEEDREEMMPSKLRSREIPQSFVTKNYVIKKAEPIFIRIDKFEESMKIFREIKSQVSEIENLIKNTKEIKAKEDEELNSWEKEMQSIKNQIEKVNQEIFSRIG